MKFQYSRSAGFSAIELLVTLFVASALVLAFYQLFTVIDEGNINAKNSAIASDLASSNLSKYPSIASFASSGRTCSNTSVSAHNLVDSPTGSYQGLPGNVAQKVSVIFPKGCTNEDLAKIESTVTYGPSGSTKTVVQATYVN
jgi:Tfp pilus assembly protein PilV